MITFKFKTVVTAVLLVIAITANANYVKTVYKSWGADKVSMLSIQNKFGNINFVNNRNDSVTVEVKLEIMNTPQSRAEALAKQIDFKMWLSGSELRLLTNFSNDFKTNQEFNIVYTINIPSNKALNVSNMYGNVTMADLNAAGKFMISYGNLQGRNLIAPESENIGINIKYGNAGLNNVKRLNAEVSYGKLNADKIDEANFKTEYSQVKVNRIDNARIMSKYDHFDISNIVMLFADSKFTTWSVGKLEKIMNLEAEYGNVKIAKVNIGFESIKIRNNYGNIVVGIPRSESYRLHADCFYCDVKHHTGDIEKESSNNRTTIRGKVGEGTAVANVMIESKYGKVSLMEQ
jgi:hypothetical protein